MNGEATQKKRKSLMIWIAALGALVVTGLAIVFVRSDGGPITFKIVDAETGLPVTNVTVTTWERWTRLPLEKLRVPGLKSWRVENRICETGAIIVPKVGRASKASVGQVASRIDFRAPGYDLAIFLRKDSDHGWVLSTPLRRPLVWATQDVAVARSVVTIPLQRKDKGAQP